MNEALHLHIALGEGRGGWQLYEMQDSDTRDWVLHPQSLSHYELILLMDFWYFGGNKNTFSINIFATC